MSQQTFDERLINLFKSASQSAFETSAELRGVLVIMDYHGGLNEAGAKSAVWASRPGEDHTLDSLFGAIQQTTRMLQSQLDKLNQIAVETRQRLVQDINQIKQLAAQQQQEQAGGDQTTEAEETPAS